MRMSDWSSDVCSSDLFCARSREQTMSDYIPGFGNHISTEAVAGALPVGQNSPQRPAFGLYTEQLSGTAFTAPRHETRRSWLYRMRPTAEHPPSTPYAGAESFAPGQIGRASCREEVSQRVEL